MLSRVADSLYWLGRYVERAENLARMVEITRRDALEAFNHQTIDNIWNPVIYATCLQDDLPPDQKKALADDPAYYITLDPVNPMSIASCVSLARENARTVRDQLSEEMWLELNSIHLYLKSDQANHHFRNDPDVLFRKIIRFSIIFQGLSESTILHDEGWHFLLLGKFIERADKTSRILDTLTFSSDAPAASSILGVLLSCSGFTAFRSEYGNDSSLKNVASFLFFSPDFPRSIRFCMRKIEGALLEISGTSQGTFSNEAERLTGSALAALNFTQIDQLLEDGLHERIDEIQSKLNDIGQNVFENYVLLPSEIRQVVRTEGLQFSVMQQQQQELQRLQ